MNRAFIIISITNHATEKKCLTATVLLTWSCNFRCIYCYEGAGELRCENMTKDRAGAIANFLIKCSEEQRGELIHVVLFGGEPLLNIDVGYSQRVLFNKP